MSQRSWESLIESAEQIRKSSYRPLTEAASKSWKELRTAASQVQDASALFERAHSMLIAARGGIDRGMEDVGDAGELKKSIEELVSLAQSGEAKADGLRDEIKDLLDNLEFSRD